MIVNPSIHVAMFIDFLYIGFPPYLVVLTSSIVHDFGKRFLFLCHSRSLNLYVGSQYPNPNPRNSALGNTFKNASLFLS